MVIPLRFGRRRPTHWLLVGAIAAGALSVAPALAEPEFEIGLNFTGLTMADFLRAPPDTMGAVGDQHIVEVLNGILAVYQKSDGVRVMRRRTARFWRELGFPPDSLHGDPRILYDAPSQRWILVALDRFRAPNRFLLAVSQTPDPRQGWTAFAIDSDLTGQRWADFPILGIDGEAVHLWANMVDAVSDFVVGGMLIVLPQAELVSATPTVSGATTFDFPSEYGWAPVIDLDGSRMPAQMLNIEGGFPLFVQEIAGDATSPALGDRWRFSTNLYPHPPNADQPGPLRDLETSGWFSSARSSATGCSGSSTRCGPSTVAPPSAS
jgi:hypothetical protein